MKNVLGQTTLLTGAIGSFQTMIARSVLAEAAEESGAVLAYITDDATGVSILQSWNQLERIRGKTNTRLSIEVVHPALTVEDQIKRIKAVQDKRPLIVVMDYSRDLAAFDNGNPFLHWQRLISRALTCKVLTIVHDGHLPIKATLDWRPFENVFKVKDGHVQGPGGPRERINEPWDLVQAKGGHRVVHLIGRPHVGTIVFDEVKEAAHV